MKKIILFLSVLLAVLINTHTASAYTIEQKDDPNNIMAFTKNSEAVYILFDLNVSTNKKVKKIERTIYTANYKSVYSTRTDTADVNYTRVDIYCPGYYQFKFYNNNNELIGTVRVVAYDSDFTDTSSCSYPTDQPPSGGGGNNDNDDNNQPDQPPSGGGGNNDNDDNNQPDQPPSGGGGNNDNDNDDDEKWENDDPETNDAAGCAQKAQKTGQSWEYKQNPKTKEWHCVLTTDCLYNKDLWYCKNTENEPKEPVDPYDRDGNGINDYAEQDWDNPSTIIPYCDQIVPGTHKKFSEYSDVPCKEKDDGWYDLPYCKNNGFIEWVPCRNGDVAPWDEEYPETDIWGGNSGNEEPQQCGLCKIFDCPGWDEYLIYLEDLIDELLGKLDLPSEPDLIDAPKPPNIFDILNNVDERNDVQKPTGQEDPNLKNSTFNANDIKNSADEIQFRDDPTSGFKIDNPLDTLPEGREAPKPETSEKLPYPESNGSNTQNQNIPYPSSPTGSFAPPNYNDSIKYPTP